MLLEIREQPRRGQGSRRFRKSPRQPRGRPRSQGGRRGRADGKLDAVGKPVDLRLSPPVDGPGEVDLAKMKGKVVCYDFWANVGCALCGEMPEVKAEPNEKNHAKGGSR